MRKDDPKPLMVDVAITCDLLERNSTPSKTRKQVRKKVQNLLLNRGGGATTQNRRSESNQSMDGPASFTKLNPMLS